MIYPLYVNPYNNIVIIRFRDYYRATIYDARDKRTILFKMYGIGTYKRTVWPVDCQKVRGEKVLDEKFRVKQSVAKNSET